MAWAKPRLLGPCGWRQAAMALALALGMAPLLSPGAPARGMGQAGADPLPQIRALREEGRLQEALEVATAALQAEPTRRDLRMERGFLLGALRRYEEALAEYEAILAENPGDAEALLEHAQVKTLQGKYDEAEGEFRFVLALSPGSAGAAFGLGDVLTWKGDLAGARASYLEYVQAQPGDPRGHLRLANLALLMGDRAEARARFGEALRLDPANAEARAGLARAERFGPRFRFELGYTHETLTRGEPDWRQGSMLLIFRPRLGTEFSLGAQHFTRFGEDDQLASLGFEQGVFQTDTNQFLFTLSGNFSQSFNNGRLLPKQIYEGQLAILAAPRLLLFASYTFSDFQGNTTAATLSPGAQLSLPWRFSLLGRYFRTESTGNEPSNAFLAQLGHDTVIDLSGTPRFQPYLGFAHGGLAAGALTSVELRNANSQFNSFFTGFSWRILARFGIKADYAVQAVKHVYVKHTFGLTTFFEY